MRSETLRLAVALLRLMLKTLRGQRLNGLPLAPVRVALIGRPGLTGHWVLRRQRCLCGEAGHAPGRLVTLARACSHLQVTSRGAKVKPLGKGQEAWMVTLAEVASRTEVGWEVSLGWGRTLFATRWVSCKHIERTAPCQVRVKLGRLPGLQ